MWIHYDHVEQGHLCLSGVTCQPLSSCFVHHGQAMVHCFHGCFHGSRTSSNSHHFLCFPHNVVVWDALPHRLLNGFVSFPLKQRGIHLSSHLPSKAAHCWQKCSRSGCDDVSCGSLAQNDWYAGHVAVVHISSCTRAEKCPMADFELASPKSSFVHDVLRAQLALRHCHHMIASCAHSYNLA